MGKFALLFALAVIVMAFGALATYFGWGEDK